MATANLGLLPLALRRNQDQEMAQILAMGASGGGPRIIGAGGSVPSGNAGSQIGAGLGAIGGLLEKFGSMRKAQEAEAQKKAADQTMQRAAQAFSGGVKEWRDPDTATQGPGRTFTKDGIEYSHSSYPVAGTGDVLVQGQKPGLGAALDVLAGNTTTAPMALQARMDMAMSGKTPPLSMEARMNLAQSLDPEGKDTTLWAMAKGAPDDILLINYVQERYVKQPTAKEPKVYGNDRTGYYTLDANMRPQFHIAPLGAEPTPLERNLEAAGLQRGTPAYRNAILQAVMKPQVDARVNPAPPSGYRNEYDDKGMLVAQVPIPGGPVAQEAAAKEAAAAAGQEQREINASVVNDDIGRAIAMIEKDPVSLTGLGAFLSSGIPGTSAYDLGEILNTLKANSAFDQLQAMREASPTGAALGSVSDTEGKRLESVRGSLVQSQTPEQLVYNLKRFSNVYNDVIHGSGKGPERYDLGGGADTRPGEEIPMWNKEKERFEFDGGVEATLDQKTGKWVKSR